MKVNFITRANNKCVSGSITKLILQDIRATIKFDKHWIA